VCEGAGLALYRGGRDWGHGDLGLSRVPSPQSPSPQLQLRSGRSP
jgi:hypothetical protein